MAKRKTEGRPRPSPRSGPRQRAQGLLGGIWLYGVHAVFAALANPDRRIRRVLALPDHAERVRQAAPESVLTEADRAEIDRRLPPGAVHQGIAAEVEPLPALGVEDVVRLASAHDHALVVVLDQVSDPQNIGAVLRNAAAFGASAVVVPDHGSPDATGALAKAAAGALATLPPVRVVNLLRAPEPLKHSDERRVGTESARAL